MTFNGIQIAEEVKLAKDYRETASAFVSAAEKRPKL